MELSLLSAVSPIDGRYRKQIESLAPYFSEFGLIQYRVRIEIEYFIALCQIPLPQLRDFPADIVPALRQVYTDFMPPDALWIKEKEKTINHDVKAVEYFVKDKFIGLGLEKYIEFIHFGLTSQDINNTAIPLALKEFLQTEFANLFEKLLTKLEQLANTWANVPMLAFTHGQPASPTRLGKEIGVFVYRLAQQYGTLQAVPHRAKFGGATGNLNAHFATYPHIDWLDFANRFVEQQLGLERSQFTTQIDNYDFLAANFDNLRRINTILIDLTRDIWTYISMGYFKQNINENEVGSSAMPHKVNPIDFENAEGNLSYANAILGYLSEKLPISRLQRDLTDSTVLRNIGVPFAHVFIAFKSLLKGLEKIALNEEKIYNDLLDNQAVVAEALQNILRREGYPQPYETLKALTRTSQKMTAATILQFIDGLDIDESVKNEMKLLTPFNYLGKNPTV